MNKERGLRNNNKILDDPLLIADKSNMLVDIHKLIGRWFSALEDEGCDTWTTEECLAFAEKYRYTKEDYKRYCNTII